jgi:hypothetical protein
VIGVASAGTLHPALPPFPRVGLGQSAPLGLTRKGQDIVCRVIGADLGKVMSPLDQSAYTTSIGRADWSPKTLRKSPSRRLGGEDRL